MRYKLLKFLFWFTIVNTTFIACKKSTKENVAGQWHSTIKTDGGELPFYIKFIPNADSTTYSSFAINGDENLAMDTAFFKNDSIHIPIEIFDAEIVAKVSGNKMTGNWKRFIGGTKYISSEFKAELADKELFSISSEQPESVDGKWATTFISQPSGNTTVSVGIFKQSGKKVTGTFLTTTGDYRYLAGVMDGDSLKLSTFDGTHLFLFKAKKTGNTLTGKFWSNIHSVENWTATLDPKLTYLKPGFDKIEFAFPATDGKVLNISDKAFGNKVKIIQIMGTWCPNCMDESKYLAPWYDKNKDRGVEIIGLAYEKSNEMAVSGPKIEKMKQRFGINYPVLLAGLKGGAEAAKSLPMLNTVLGFPTTIIIDKKGIVRQIHTGFSGPGTGQYYEEWIQDFNLLIDKLVAE
jgi:thiol-disulfide isomerase/thioredoxin